MVLLRTGRYAAADYPYGDCAGGKEKEETEEEKKNPKETYEIDKQADLILCVKSACFFLSRITNTSCKPISPIC